MQMKLPEKIDFNNTLEIQVTETGSNTPMSHKHSLVTDIQIQPKIYEHQAMDFLIIVGYVQTDKAVKMLSNGGFLTKNKSQPNYHKALLCSYPLLKVQDIRIKLDHEKWLTITDHKYMIYPFKEDNPHGAVYDMLKVFYT